MQRRISTFGIFTFFILAIAACTSNQKKVSGFVRYEKYVDSGTHKIRMVVSDCKSDFTILIESGGGRFSDAYEVIQDTLAKLSGCRVVSYDRSGSGKSEPGPPDLTESGSIL